jgi:hypothetical protein
LHKTQLKRISPYLQCQPPNTEHRTQTTTISFTKHILVIGDSSQKMEVFAVSSQTTFKTNSTLAMARNSH